MRKPIATAILAALAAAGAGSARTSPAAPLDAEHNLLQFSAHPFDTQRDVLRAPAPFSDAVPSGPRLQLVQFTGPVRQEWLDALVARGITPVQYVASNGYVVWLDDAAQARLDGLRGSVSWLQFSAPFHGFLKVDPGLSRRLSAAANGDEEVDVTVQVYAHAGVEETRRFVQGKAVLPVAQRGPLGPGAATLAWAPVLKFQNLQLRVRLADVPDIAQRADVTFVGERLPTRLLDEKQALIMSGDFAPGIASPSYLQFLLDRGFSQTPSDYPIVDVTDSTIDEGGTGNTVLNTEDEMLHEQGDVTRPVRVAYFRNCSARPDDQVGAADGHGSLNAGVIAGYDQREGYPYRDADGQQLGLGINPFARVGSTTIFVSAPPSYDVNGCGGNDQGVIHANAAGGAKISSNSWGSAASGTYGERDQLYDAAVRDVDVDAAGDQPMIYVVSAANDGPGISSVGSPGSAKNVITVGASENLRPFSSVQDICPNDGSDAADDPQSVAGFSSRGPVPGQRVKPEVIAPGTHIQAGASVYSGFQGGGVCIRYYPESPEQTEFAASSGTSHSAPAISGAASLAYWWIEHGGAGDAAGSLEEIGGSRAPSPAMMKAWLMAHPSYLTGAYANDNLPSNAQGYGMPNLADMFDATPKVLLDQSEVFDASGETRSYAWGVADPTKPVRIALAYTDAPGALGASPQVNDLDLEVEIGGQTYLGNRFDHQWSVTGGSADAKNNYEAVFLPAGAIGDLTIRVKASNIAGDGVPGSGDATDQDFALVCSNCSQQPSFSLTAAQSALQVCSGSARTAAVHLHPIVGFAGAVGLSASGNPAGTSVAFDPNPATPPADATLSVAATTAAAPGRYPMQVRAVSRSIEKTLDLELGVFDVPPAAPGGESPADGSADVSPTPTFMWTAAADAYDYRVEIATDPGFANIVLTHETTDTAWTVGSGQSLDSSARYWWRVIAQNPCGDSGPAAPGADTIFADGFDAAALVAGHEFTTLALPGDCPVDATTQVLFDDDLEGGAAGWTHGAASGSVDGWSLGAAANSGSHAWQANAPASGAINDQWLISPSLTLPAELDTLSLKFWSRQALKSGGAGSCNDAAIVEASSDGTVWTQLTAPLTDPFDGSVSGAFGNPLAGRQAWCGDPQAYLNSVVDVQSLAGRTVKFRFRLGHDRFPHRAGVNWAIDDVKLTGCAH